MSPNLAFHPIAILNRLQKGITNLIIIIVVILVARSGHSSVVLQCSIRTMVFVFKEHRMSAEL